MCKVIVVCLMSRRNGPGCPGVLPTRSDPPRRNRRWMRCLRDPPATRSAAPCGSTNSTAASIRCCRPRWPRTCGWRTSTAPRWSSSPTRPHGTPGCAWRPRNSSTPPAPSGSMSQTSLSGRHRGRSGRLHPPQRPARNAPPGCLRPQPKRCVPHWHPWTLPWGGRQARTGLVRTGRTTLPDRRERGILTAGKGREVNGTLSRRLHETIFGLNSDQLHGLRPGVILAESMTCVATALRRGRVSRRRPARWRSPGR